MASYEVKVTGGGLSYEEQVPRQVALQIVDLVEDHRGDLRGARWPELPEVREWFDRARPRTHLERFAVLAAYVEDAEDRPLRWDEIRDLLEGAGQEVPVNLGRDLRRALDQGLLEPAGPHPDELEDPRDAEFRPTEAGWRAAGAK